jgi:NADPH2:quinone reductase
MRAIQISEFGGPEVLRLVELPDPEPSGGRVVLDVDAAGVNYADTHASDDSYLAKQNLPFIPGTEVVGRTPDGRRLAAFTGTGGYAEKVLVDPRAAFAVPDDVTDEQVLALLVQGLTAWHLLRTSTHLAEGETVVVHAAAGGVGTLAVQLARLWGAGRVIGVASTPDKRALAASLGAHATVDAGSDDLKTALEQANDGRKVDVVLEMVGGPTFDASLAALAPFGRLAVFGMAGRVHPTPVNPAQLMGRSRTVAGFWLAHCITRPDMLVPQMQELLALVAAGRLVPQVGPSYALADAAKAHEDMRARATTGKVVLRP